MLFLGKPVAVIATWKALPLWPSLAQSTISRVLFFFPKGITTWLPPKNNRKQTFWPSPKDTNRGKNCPLSLSIFPFGLFYFSSIILQPSKETNENVSTLKKKPFGHSVKALLWFCFIQVPPYLDWHSIQWNRLENNVIAHHLWRLWLVFNNVWWLDLSSQEQVNHFVNQLKSPLVTQIWVVLSFLFCYSRGLSRKLYSFFSFGTNPITTLTHITVILCVCAWPTLIFWLNLTFLKFICSGKLDFEVPTATGRWRLGWNHERSRQCRDGRVGGVRTFLDQLINFFYFTFIQNK